MHQCSRGADGERRQALAEFSRTRTYPPDGKLLVVHRHLIRFGPALLVVLGLILGGLGVGLDREWLVGLALVPLFLGILLPRLTGSIEVGPSGVKGQLISPDEVRALVRVEAEAAGLPEDEIERVVEKVDEVVPQAVELRLSPARARANASLDLRVIGRSLGGTIADGIVSDYGRDARLDEGNAG